MLAWIDYLVADISFIQEGELTACGSGSERNNSSGSLSQEALVKKPSDFVSMFLLTELGRSSDH